MTDIILAAGIKGIQESIIGDWIGPIFIIAVAAFAIVFIKDRAWMKLIGFVGIAAVVGVLVFGGDALFGGSGAGSSGTLTKFAETQAQSIGK